MKEAEEKEKELRAEERRSKIKEVDTSEVNSKAKLYAAERMSKEKARALETAKGVEADLESAVQNAVNGSSQERGIVQLKLDEAKKMTSKNQKSAWDAETKEQSAKAAVTFEEYRKRQLRAKPIALEGEEVWRDIQGY